jgi:hypothetical protein
MRSSGSRDHVLDIKLTTKPCIKGSKTLINVAAKSAEMIDILVEFAA